MSRERLPDRRTGFAVQFRTRNINADFTVGFSLFPASWRCAEVFCNVTPSQGLLERDIRDAAILASFALQHGAPLEKLIEGVTHEEDGSASSIIGTALELVAADIARMRGDHDPLSPANDGSGNGGGANVVRPPCAGCSVADLSSIPRETVPGLA